jgi:hypothetical protein
LRSYEYNFEKQIKISFKILQLRAYLKLKARLKARKFELDGIQLIVEILGISKFHTRNICFIPLGKRTVCGVPSRGTRKAYSQFSLKQITICTWTKTSDPSPVLRLNFCYFSHSTVLMLRDNPRWQIASALITTFASVA